MSFESRIQAAGPARHLVIALHCSGGAGRQWRALSGALAGVADIACPELIGTAEGGSWSGAGPFTLADEAEPILALVDGWAGPVHLVGHSYGGGVALQVAAARPGRISGLALFEPTAFSLLRGRGPREEAALATIRSVARSVEAGLVTGAYADAACRFVDYWGGQGAWAALPARARADMIRYLPKVCLDFRALIDSPLSLDAFRALTQPVLVLRGEHAPSPTVLIVEGLRSVIPDARSVVIADAGHMGPVTHATEVVGHIAEHIRRAMGAPAQALAGA